MVHKENASIRQVVHVQELPPWGPRAPQGHERFPLHLRLVELPDQGRQDVAVLEVVFVVGTVEVGGHHGDEVAAVLGAIGLAGFDTGIFAKA